MKPNADRNLTSNAFRFACDSQRKTRKESFPGGVGRNDIKATSTLYDIQHVRLQLVSVLWQVAQYRNSIKTGLYFDEAETMLQVRVNSSK